MILKFRKDAIKRKNIVNRYRLLVSMQGGTGNKRCIIIIIVISAFKDLVQGDYIFLVRKKKKKKSHINYPPPFHCMRANQPTFYCKYMN